MFQSECASVGRSPRRGTTLLELLVVILVILSITALSIPVMAPAMQGRRMREGARIFTTFINAARNRAIESGRPAGVWLERMPNYPEAVSNLYMAEVPPPYAGDFADSMVSTFYINMSGRTAGAATSAASLPNATDRDFWNIVVPRTRTTFFTDSWANPDPLEQTLVREGDQIKFEGRDRLYTLRVVETQVDGDNGAGGSRKWWYFLRGRNCAATTGPEGGYTNERDQLNRYYIRAFDGQEHLGDGNDFVLTCNGLSTQNERTRPGLRYQIYRQPQRLLSGGVKLPEGIVIDLNFSGTTDGTLMRLTSTAQTGTYNNIPFHPRVDANDTTFCPYWGDPVYPFDRNPVMLVFSPGGNLDRVYCHRTGTANSNWHYQALTPNGPLFFLIGQLDKLYPGEQYRVSQTPTQNMEYQLKKNWLDVNNLWVSLDPTTGFISASPVDDIVDTSNDPLRAMNPVNLGWTRLTASRMRRALGGK